MEKLEHSQVRHKSVLDICVRNPITHNTWEKGRYTSYEIAVNTSNKSFCLSSSTTRRRFSEFEWLRKTLKKHHPLVVPTPLPPKKFFEDRFDPNFIAFRMKGLEDFLNSLLQEKVFLSDTTMHLFLQTNLTIKEMKEYIEGKMMASLLDSLWKANGIKENCREFAGLYTKEDNGWSKIEHTDKPRADNLTVQNDSEEPRDSNSSDICSSFSDDEDRLTKFPSVSLLPHASNELTVELDSGLPSSTDRHYSPELSVPQLRTNDPVNATVTNSDLSSVANEESSQKIDELIANSSSNQKEICLDTNLNISEEYSINSTY